MLAILAELEALATHDNLIGALKQGFPLERIVELYEGYKQIADDAIFSKQLNQIWHGEEMHSHIGNPKANRLLRVATIYGHQQAFEFFLQQGASLTNKANSHNLLQLAVIGGYPHLVMKLVRKYEFPVEDIRFPPAQNHAQVLSFLMGVGFNPCHLTSGTSMIHLCAMTDDMTTLKIIDQLAKEHNILVDYGIHDGTNITPLMYAASSSELSLEVIAFLINHGADVNATDKDSETALQNAVAANQFEKVKLLLELKADPDGNPKKVQVRTPFLYAAAHTGNVDIARLLILHGANPRRGYVTDDKEGKYFKTPFHSAIEENDDTEFIKFLLTEVRMDPNGKDVLPPSVKDCTWLTPLQCACSVLDDKAVQLLLQYGADPNYVIKNGKDHALMQVVPAPLALGDPKVDDEVRINIVKLLLSYGADFNVYAKFMPVVNPPPYLKLILDCFPLQDAVANRNISAIRKLLDQNLDLACVKFVNGDTLLHSVIKCIDQGTSEDQLAVLNLLAKKSNHLFTADMTGKLPRDCAAAKGLLNVVELLTSDLDKQLALSLNDDVMSVINDLLSGYKTLSPTTVIPQGIQIFITDMMTSQKIIEPDNVEPLDQSARLASLFIARFTTLASFMEIPGLVYECTIIRINKLLAQSEIAYSNRQKFGLLASMPFTDIEAQILFRAICNLHRICNNELQLRQKSELKLKDMHLGVYSLTTHTAQNPMGFHQNKRKENVDNKIDKRVKKDDSKKEKADANPPSSIKP